MATETVSITEFSIGHDQSNVLGNMAQVPPAVEQTIAVGGASVASAPFQLGTTAVRLYNGSANSIAIAWGVTPVAVVPAITLTSAPGTMAMAPGQTEYFNITQGNLVPMRVAVIAAP